MCVCVCVCVCARARARARAHIYIYLLMYNLFGEFKCYILVFSIKYISSFSS